eukprot:TRINITY_DN2646_c0_g1_i1.p1 TRINITY_DN2646_c0_g1~~TRINITY_DN2646_c0_g1_i1.p1  ORF type:complete len:557 (+),score=78.36 TRINITY_DN2646_c0_g1_i1:22-1671(+)
MPGGVAAVACTRASAEAAVAAALKLRCGCAPVASPLGPGGLTLLAGPGCAGSTLAVDAASGDAVVVDGKFVWQGEAVAASAAFLLERTRGAPVTETLAQLVAELRGVWAFALWEASQGRLWFGRDPLGQRSLLFGAPAGEACGAEEFCLCSVAPSLPTARDSAFPRWSWDEVTPFHLHCCARGTVAASGAQLWRRCDPTPLHPGEDPLGEHLATVFGCRTIAEHEQQPVLLPSEVAGLAALLEAAVRQHIDAAAAPPPVAGGIRHARFGVLFSGGVDSTVVAAMVDRCCPEGEPIELLNVAFTTGDPATAEDAPDRALGIRSYHDLCQVAPNRRWVFVKVDVTREQLSRALPRVVGLMHPSRTIMDACIAAAELFAAEGVGTADGAPYASEATLLLLGQGSDEQFAGYGRHRTSFARGGWAALQRELAKDFSRLWLRNLGRDDRVLSSLGKETFLPFLDERVVRYVTDLPLAHICDLSLPSGVGDKRILREVAASLGLHESAQAAKKAMQFGTRIAKALRQELGMSCKRAQSCGGDKFDLDLSECNSKE